MEVSFSKLTEWDATEMDEAKSRELAEWIQQGAISKVRESQDVPESRLMSLRWITTSHLMSIHKAGRRKPES